MPQSIDAVIFCRRPAAALVSSAYGIYYFRGEGLRSPSGWGNGPSM
ncbi:hypothetical protein D8I24_0242 (plasmid) [Cupriavidus necator H850]|nr:hypothetical protein D8I24_0242 [Cupriavidus necator H850]